MKPEWDSSALSPEWGCNSVVGPLRSWRLSPGVWLNPGELVPKSVPLIVGAENAQMSDLVGVILEPSRARLLEPRVQDMAMT